MQTFKHLYPYQEEAYVEINKKAYPPVSSFINCTKQKSANRNRKISFPPIIDIQTNTQWTKKKQGKN